MTDATLTMLWYNIIISIVLSFITGGLLGYLIGDTRAWEVENPKPEEEVSKMKITDLSIYVSRNQKGKKISVAQIAEILRTANRKTDGAIYKVIRGTKK